MIRVLGAVFVIFATGYAGYEHGRTLQRRICQLENMKRIFVELYSDVEYGACTLIESFERIALKQEPLYRQFLNKVCEKMRKTDAVCDCRPFGIIFEETTWQELKNSCLHESDKAELVRLGKQLGNNQRNGQLRILQLYIQELEDQIEELGKCKKEKQKISQVLGIAGGVLIVILLL